MRNERNEHMALAIGFVLILLVIIITIFRSNLFSEKKISPQSEQNKKSETSTSLPVISSKDLQAKILQKKDDFVMVDVRPFEDYAAEHIVDTVNIPLDEFPAGEKIDSHKLIILIGSSDGDSNIQDAYNKLKDENFANVKILAGGMDTWKNTIGSTVTYGDPKSFVDQTKVSYIDPSQLNDAAKANVPMFILDVRSHEDYIKGHVSGAVNVPFDDLEKNRTQITANKVVILGINELQEFQAGVQLYDMLLVQPFIVRGAMPKWTDNGYPLTK